MTVAETGRLHPDWPEADLIEPGEYDTYYDLPTPLDDLGHALGVEYGQMSASSIPSPVEEPVRLHDLAEVVRYYVEHHDEVWTPAYPGGGTELKLIVVARTKDGRWVAVEAWNDYTGWGCQDDSDIRIGASEDQVVRYGLSNDARARLGYPAVEATS
jgi:hypothetical protein